MIKVIGGAQSIREASNHPNVASSSGCLPPAFGRKRRLPAFSNVLLSWALVDDASIKMLANNNVRNQAMYVFCSRISSAFPVSYFFSAGSNSIRQPHHRIRFLKIFRLAMLDHFLETRDDRKLQDNYADFQ